MSELLRIPDELAAVHERVAEGLVRVIERFDRHLRTDVAPVAELVRHVERYRGKMLRPMLCLLSGMATSRQTPPELTENHVTLAAVCEMVHMATLVHDDVLDEAEVRRGGRTINSLKGNEAAVMLGDYLIAAAYHLCAQVQDQWYSLEVARVSMSVCSGELMQLANRGNLELDLATYFGILDRKTAVLIGAACELGARASGATPEVAVALRDYGREVGIAFQIQDDLLDLLGREDDVGKSVGRDMELGKPTLPLISHLLESPRPERDRAMLLAERAAGGDGASGRELREVLVTGGAVERARNEAFRRVEQACKGLQGLPASPARRYLEHLAQMAVRRGK